MLTALACELRVALATGWGFGLDVVLYFSYFGQQVAAPLDLVHEGLVGHAGRAVDDVDHVLLA